MFQNNDGTIEEAMANELVSSLLVIALKMVGRPAIWIPLLITTCFYVELESLALSHNDLESANKYVPDVFID